MSRYIFTGQDSNKHEIEDGYFVDGDMGEYWSWCHTCDTNGMDLMLVELDPLSSHGHVFLMGMEIAAHLDLSFQTFTNMMLEGKYDVVQG